MTSFASASCCRRRATSSRMALQVLSTRHGFILFGKSHWLNLLDFGGGGGGILDVRLRRGIRRQATRIGTSRVDRDRSCEKRRSWSGSLRCRCRKPCRRSTVQPDTVTGTPSGLVQVQVTLPASRLGRTRVRRATSSSADSSAVLSPYSSRCKSRVILLHLRVGDVRGDRVVAARHALGVDRCACCLSRSPFRHCRSRRRSACASGLKLLAVDGGRDRLALHHFRVIHRASRCRRNCRRSTEARTHTPVRKRAPW